MLAAQNAALEVKTELRFNFRPPGVMSAAAVLKPYHLCASSSPHGCPVQAAEKFLCLLFGSLLEQAENNLLGVFAAVCSNKRHHHSPSMHRAPEKHRQTFSEFDSPACI